MNRNFKRAISIFLVIIMFISVAPIGDMGIEASASTSNNWSWPTTKTTPSATWPKYSGGSYHSGIDFAVSVGTPVYSTCDGEVVDVKSLTTSYGKHIKIKAKVNGVTVYMRYCHLSSFAISVDDKVSSGQLIGYSGNTGNSTGPHLHYEVRNASDTYGSLSNPTLNPSNYLPGTNLTFETNGALNNGNKVEYNGSASYMTGKYYKQLCNVDLTGNGVIDIVNVAISQIGYKSGSSNNDLSGSTTSTSNVKYSEYGRVMGSNPNDWCAYFVSWCARRAGISKSILPNFSVCQTACDEILPDANCVKHKKSSGYVPKKGDLIFFINDEGRIYHVGIVKANSDGSTVKYIDGNNSSEGRPNRVHDSSKSLNDGSIWGYYTPNYKQQPVITRANGDNHTEITLKWTKVDNATKYTLERRKAGDSAYTTVKSSLTATSYTDKDLSKNQRYFYKVTAYNGSTKLGTSEAVGVYTKFSAPTITTVSDANLKITWDSVSKAESYTVMRRKSGDDEYKEIKTITDTSYTDSSLSASTQYYYWIKANCNVDGTEIVAKSTSAGQYTFAKAPTIKNVNDISKSEIEITWNDVSGAESYRIERRKAGDSEYKTLKSGLTTTSYNDTGLETGQRYYYIVYAKNSAGESAASTAVGGYTKFNAPTVTTVSTTQLNLSWDSVSKAESYTVKRRTYNGEYTDVKTVTETSYTDSGLQSGTQYYYWIQANCNVDGTSIVAKSESKGQYTKLATPKATTISSNSLKVSWDSIKGADTYKYVVQRKLPNESSYKTITTITSNSYTDNNLSPSTTYNYRIQVLNNDGKTCSTTDKVDGKTAACSHSYISTVTTVATCKSEGVKNFTCSKCSSNYTEKTSKNPNNHIGGTEIRNAKTSTCTAEGYTGDTYCKGCGVKTKTGSSIAKISHSYISTVTTPATCKSEGVKTFACSKCGGSYIEKIDKNPNNHTGGTEIKNIKSTTCTTEGYTGDTYCKGCEAILTLGEKIAETGHKWKETSSTANKKVYTCEACGETYIETFECTHSYKTTVVEPTCMEQGYTLYECTVCDYSKKTDYADATGHSMGQWKTIIEETCTEDGQKSRRCINCEYMQNQTIYSSGHSMGSWKTVKAATCDENGEKRSNCFNCDYVKTQVIYATGHSMGLWKTVKSATCTEDGLKNRICSHCDNTETKIIKAVGHSYVSEATKDATCATSGIETFSCSICEDTYTETIEKLGHKYSSSYTIDKKATCSTEGSKSKHCIRSGCTAKTNVTAIAKLAHTYDNNCDKTCNVCKATRSINHTYKITTTKATLSKNGKIETKCTVCDDISNTTTIYYPKTIKLSATTFTYNGKTVTPSVTVKDSKGNTLKKDVDYTVTYPKKRKSIGKYTVTVTFKGNYSGTKKLTFEIVPAKVNLSKVSAGKKQLTATWKTVSGATGYEVQYSTSKKFTKKTTKTVTIKKAKTKKTTIKKLKKGKKYYVKVRAYKTVSGKKIYGAWSAVKSVKVK